MVRSINIEKTDTLVWDAIKLVLQQIYDKPLQCEILNKSKENVFNDLELVPSAEIELTTNPFGHDGNEYLALSETQQDNVILRGQSLSAASDVPSFDSIALVAMNWSPQSLDSLSDQERKGVINSVLSKVSVFFDSEIKKHRLDVTFSRQFSSLLKSFTNTVGKITLSQSGGSAGGIPTKQDYFVTVE